MQKIFLFLLAFFARNIIKVHRPYIVGITGTVGKTTISSHVYAYLSHEYGAKNVMYSPYHYNGEYGLPLTIIGAKTGGKNPLLWLLIFAKALLRTILPYPRYLVLEYGIDHPGEMDFLLSIAVPNVAILTEVLPNHIEQFGTFDSYRREKLKITENPEELIIHDSQRQFVSREAWYYGRGGMSDIDASHIEIVPTGTRAVISADHHEYTLELPVF
jgi:UDP-N-acetylmuramoyl-tripeptide--D-alanyl-D-alanine ligase